MRGLDITDEFEASKKLTYKAASHAMNGDYDLAYMAQTKATERALECVKKFQQWLVHNFGK